MATQVVLLRHERHPGQVIRAADGRRVHVVLVEEALVRRNAHRRIVEERQRLGSTIATGRGSVAARRGGVELRERG
jgi:hypothetical protein